ncbi:hypothetical protein VKT23_011333 [Stygiomarasmius scandens]|uniref:Uncharacterized protein n=1 Tax=Marasmiellus scandens TaxID=2682957 RepID=A0ABR1JA38_9AGAR
MDSDDIAEQLEGIVGKLSGVWYEAITTVIDEPNQTVEEIRQALEEYVPFLLDHNIIPLPNAAQDRDPDEDTNADPDIEANSKEAVDALRLFITSSMGVREITETLYALLGNLSSKWHQAITLATAEPGETAEEVLERFEQHVPSLLGDRRSSRHRNTVNYHLPALDSDPDVEQEDSGSSDWGADHEKEKALREKRRERLQRMKEKNGEIDDQVVSDSSSSDEDEKDPPVVLRRRYVGLDGKLKGQAGPKARSKGKQIKVVSPSDHEDEEQLDGSDEEEGAGRIPAAMKTEIWNIRADYEQKMEEVAQRFRRSLQSAYHVAGDVTIASRDPNLFNIFQKWYVTEDGNNMKIPANVNPGKFLSLQWQFLRKERLDENWNDPLKVEEEFAILRDWYSSRYSNDQRMTQGPMKHDIRTVAKIVSDVAKQATLNCGIWVYAFIIDPSNHHSMITGWGKDYENMKVEYPAQITSQLHDVGILLGSEHIKAQIGSNVPKDLKSLVVAATQVGSDRERERALIPKILLYDIAQLDVARPGRFPWKNYADYAYKHQVCIVNWPDDIAAPGAGLKDVNHAVRMHGGPSRLTALRIEELIWFKDAWARKEDNPTPPEHITSKALRIVSWTDEEKNLPLEEQKDIVLVKSVDRKTLTSVINSKEWRIQQGAQANKVSLKQKPKAKSKKSPSPSPSDSERSTPPSPHLEEAPFSSPAHGEQLTHIPPRLFIGSKTQQEFLQSSNAEMADDEDLDEDWNEGKYQVPSKAKDSRQVQHRRPSQMSGPSRLPPQLNYHPSQRPDPSRRHGKRTNEDSERQSPVKRTKKGKAVERGKRDFKKLLKSHRK